MGEKKIKSLIFEQRQLLISNLGNYIPRNNSQELGTNSFDHNMLFLFLGGRFCLVLRMKCEAC